MKSALHLFFGKLSLLCFLLLIGSVPLSAQILTNGDFETAIGAARHMGQKETAKFLISLGARTDIFVLTMLGEIDLVKSLLKAYPSLLNSIGPHGFTLLHHAEKGGKDAEKLVTHLKKLGLTETFIKMK